MASAVVGNSYLNTVLYVEDLWLSLLDLSPPVTDFAIHYLRVLPYARISF